MPIPRLARLVPLALAVLCLLEGVASARPGRVALFRETGFATVDGPVIPAASLDQALAGIATSHLNTEALRTDRLTRHAFDVLVLPYGSAFPIDGWPAIREFRA